MSRLGLVLTLSPSQSGASTYRAAATAPWEDGRGRAAADPIAVMRSVEVVEVHEALEAVIERGTTDEVVAPEDNAPMLGKDRLLQALHEAIRPRVAGFDAGVANTQLRAGGGELGLELTAAVRQDPPHRPAGARDRRHQDGGGTAPPRRRRAPAGCEPRRTTGRIASGDLLGISIKSSFRRSMP